MSAETQSVRASALDAAIAFARRKPGQLLAIVLGLHLAVWTLIPLATCFNLQLDLVEDLALGKEWQLGYWKHPPLPWWVADAVYRLTGLIDSVYLLGPLAAVICLYGVWLLARKVVGAVEALIAVFALEGVHYYNFSVVKFAHDQMQLPFWAFTGLFFYRAVKQGRALDWVLAGVLLAGAFWSKYAAFVLAASLGLFLLADPVARKAWRSPGPYLMAAAFAIVIAPNFWWVINHDFLPLQYVDARARTAVHWYQYATYPLQWTGGQALNLLPAAGLLALLYAGGKIAARGTGESEAFDRRYVTWLALGPFLVTTAAGALTGRLPIAMWGYPLWLFAPLAVLMWFKPVLEPRALRRFAAGFIAVFVAMPVIYAVVEVGEPFVRDRLKATQYPGKRLADTLTRDWHDRYGTPLTYVSGTQFAANNVAVYSPDRPHVLVDGELKLSPWIDKDDLRRRGLVLVWEEEFFQADLAKFRAIFGNFDVQPMLTLPRQALHPLRPTHVFYAFIPPQP